MGLGDFLKYVAGEAAVIAQAPLIFAAAVIVVSGLAYAAARWAFGTVISQKDATIASLEARIKLRDDQLANKLQSTPPDEAKSIIQSLEARLNKLAPRRLERDHVEAIANRIGLPSGTTYKIAVGLRPTLSLYLAVFRVGKPSRAWYLGPEAYLPLE
jgi:hypothetical protein